MNQLITKLLKIVCFKSEYYILNITIFKTSSDANQVGAPYSRWARHLPSKTMEVHVADINNKVTWKSLSVEKIMDPSKTWGGNFFRWSFSRYFFLPVLSSRLLSLKSTLRNEKGVIFRTGISSSDQPRERKNREWDLKSSWILTVCRYWGAKIINFSEWKRVETKTILIFPDF